MPKNTKAIKRDILSQFRNLPEDEDVVLSPDWLWKDYRRSLSPTERPNFDRAIQELVTVGLVERMSGAIPHLRLTDKGAGLLF